MVASGVFIGAYVSVTKLLPYSERQGFILILTLPITLDFSLCVQVKSRNVMFFPPALCHREIMFLLFVVPTSTKK